MIARVCHLEWLLGSILSNKPYMFEAFIWLMKSFFLTCRKITFIRKEWVLISHLSVLICNSHDTLNDQYQLYQTVRTELKRLFILYSRDHKFVVFCFALLLPQILDYFQNQGQFWNLLVLTISKHPLLVQFDQVLAEIFEVKEIWYHFLILMTMDFTERKIIEIWTFCVKSNW